jgi:hypothetical protein
MDKVHFQKMNDAEWHIVINGEPFILRLGKPRPIPPDEFDKAVAEKFAELKIPFTTTKRLCKAGYCCFAAVEMVSVRYEAMQEIILAAANLKNAWKLLKEQGE